MGFCQVNGSLRIAPEPFPAVKFPRFGIIQVDIPPAGINGKFEEILKLCNISIFAGVNGIRRGKKNDCVKRLFVLHKVYFCREKGERVFLGGSLLAGLIYSPAFFIV